MKKALIVIGVIVLAVAIGLYVYSQGGYQDIHVAKGEHLDEAELKPVKDLIDMEFERKIQEYDLESDSTKGFFTKIWHKWNYQYPSKVFYTDDEYIYWGRVRYDFLRSEVIELNKTKKEKYEQVMQKFNHITLDKSREILAQYYNQRRFQESNGDIKPSAVYLYWIQLSEGYTPELVFLIRIDSHIYRATTGDGLEISYMTYGSLTTH